MKRARSAVAVVPFARALFGVAIVLGAVNLVNALGSQGAPF
jgi:hypothetical protein